MPTSFTQTYTQTPLTPYKAGAMLLADDYPVAANQVIPPGGVVAQVTAASVTDVQTLTGTASGGTFTIQFGNALSYVTAALAYNATAAQVQAALQALPNIDSGGVTCTGGPLGSGTVVCTFAGKLASQPQPLMVINNGNATGGSISVAHTAQGVQQYSIVNYNSALVANPTTAATLSDSATAGTWSTATSSTWEVAYTYVTAGGESLPSYAATIALATALHSIGVSSITGIPAGVTAVNFYVNGLFAKQQAVTNNATGAVTITGPAAASAAVPPPAVSTAYYYGDGSQIPIGVAKYKMATAPNGVITFGLTPTGNEYQPNNYAGNVFVSGWFSCSTLSVGGAAGVDQNTVNKLGRLTRGSLTTGVLKIY